MASFKTTAIIYMSCCGAILKMTLETLPFEIETRAFSRHFPTGYSTTRNRWPGRGLWLVLGGILTLFYGDEMQCDSSIWHYNEKQICERGIPCYPVSEPGDGYFCCFEGQWKTVVLFH